MKRAEFHQATITAQIRIVDDNRSYRLKTAQVTLLLDTDLEWQTAITQIQDAIDKLNEGLALGTHRGSSANSH